MKSKAKKEAKELIEKMMFHTTSEAKQCAIITADEKIMELKLLNDAIGITNVYLVRRLVYLNELKKEIKYYE